VNASRHSGACVGRHGGWQFETGCFLVQVGFVVRLEGGRLSEDLADFLPDYKCARAFNSLLKAEST
jgi:hypothetical protein